jgi:polyphosphate kinase 2 (PPK2 family)
MTAPGMKPKHDKKKIGKEEYKTALTRLQIELVKLQKHIIKHDEKVLIIFEGRDAGGKDGSIKRIIQL